MNCDEVGPRLSEFYDGELPAELAAAISAHVNSCDKCTGELQSFGQIAGLFREQRDLTSAPENWPELAVRLDKQKERFQPSRFWRSAQRSLPLLAASLIVAVAIGYWVVRKTSHEEVHRVAAAHVHETLTRFPEKPQAVVDELSAEYQGTQVTLAAAGELLGYEPVVAKFPSAGYRVASTHVLQMPCCKCPASVCVREDGSELLIFEHKEEQPMWFGDSPRISTNCGGQTCQCVQLPKQLAVTWKVGARYVTAVGVNGLEEIASLMTIFNHSNSSG